MEKSTRAERDDFRQKVKEEWSSMWRERFDDRVKAEGIATKDYAHLFMERGFVVFASREARMPNLSEIMDYWASEGKIYAPSSSEGGWGRFIRAHMRKDAHFRARAFRGEVADDKKAKPQLKKGGRGWLHV